jgi:TetR/AcrR family tetracycline transcriptional repressor
MTATSGEANTARRGPGRPARLSREAIVDAALALLERAPREPLGVARIAAEVDAVPAALYRHFDGLDDLLDAVLARVLGRAELEPAGRADWPEQLRGWMTALRAHLLRYPAVLPMIGRRGRTSPAWLDAMDVLIRILERAGLSGARLATTHLWIAETTVGLVMQEASLPLPDQVGAARASLAEASAEARARLEPLVPHLAKLDGDAFFAFVVDRTLDALAALAPSPVT